MVGRPHHDGAADQAFDPTTDVPERQPPHPSDPLPVPDNWAHRSQGMRCSTCMYYVSKRVLVGDKTYSPDQIGRCRRRSPTMNGWPVMFPTDWCGDHKLDEEKL